MKRIYCFDDSDNSDLSAATKRKNQKCIHDVMFGAFPDCVPEYVMPPDDRAIIFALDTKSLRENQSKFDTLGKKPAQVDPACVALRKQIVTDLARFFQNLMIRKENQCICSFVQIDSGLKEHCEGTQHVLEFAVDCMNRVRPLNRADQV